MQEKWRKSDQEGKCYIIGSENNLNCISVVIDAIYEYFLHRGPSHLISTSDVPKWKDLTEDDIADSLCYDSESFFAHR